MLSRFAGRGDWNWVHIPHQSRNLYVARLDLKEVSSKRLRQSDVQRCFRFLDL